MINKLIKLKYPLFFFSELFDSQSKLLIGAAVGVGVVAATGLAVWYQGKQVNSFPTK